MYESETLKPIAWVPSQVSGDCIQLPHMFQCGTGEHLLTVLLSPGVLTRGASVLGTHPPQPGPLLRDQGPCHWGLFSSKGFPAATCLYLGASLKFTPELMASMVLGSRSTLASWDRVVPSAAWAQRQ